MKKIKIVLTHGATLGKETGKRFPHHFLALAGSGG
jgi:hypothetical protein